MQVFILLLHHFSVITAKDYLLNGGFESNILASPITWLTSNMVIAGPDANNPTRYCDLQIDTNPTTTGYIYQYSTFLGPINVTLRFRRQINDPTGTHNLTILWNMKYLTSYLANSLTTKDCYQVVYLTSIKGINSLKFTETTTSTQRTPGFHLDDIQLLDDFYENSGNATLPYCVPLPPPLDTSQTTSSSTSTQIQGQNGSCLTNAQNTTLKILYASTEATMEAVLNIYTAVKTSFVSWFLLGTVTFWNLSLMYNMLLIRSVPEFARKFFQGLLLLFFKPNAATDFMSEKFPKLQPVFTPQSDLLNSLPKKEQFVLWFGTYQLSSWFLRNNIQNLIIFILNFLKLGLPIAISSVKCIPKFIRDLMPKPIVLYGIFLMELIGLQFFMLISAGHTILNFGYCNTSGRWNHTMQILTIWGSIVVYPLCLFAGIEVKVQEYLRVFAEKKRKKKEFLSKIKELATIHEQAATPQTLRKKVGFIFPQEYIRKMQRNRIRYHRKKIQVTQAYKVSEFLLILVMPLIIHFKDPGAFLTVVTIVLFLRLFWFFYHYNRLLLNRGQKLFTCINIFSWLILQAFYFYFICLELGGAEMRETEKILGIATAFVISFGGVFEVIRNTVTILKFIIKKIIEFVKDRQRMSKETNKLNEDEAQSCPIENINEIRVNQKCKSFPITTETEESFDKKMESSKGKTKKQIHVQEDGSLEKNVRPGVKKIKKQVKKQVKKQKRGKKHNQLIIEKSQKLTTIMKDDEI